MPRVVWNGAAVSIAIIRICRTRIIRAQTADLQLLRYIASMRNSVLYGNGNVTIYLRNISKIYIFTYL